MANNNEQLVEILRVEGIMAQGYGLNPKIVMRDKRLTPEAKCIYAYFSSFAGAGNQAFPSRDLMLDELGMSINRYYKHLKLLQNYDYIRIEKSRGKDHRFERNIYTLVALPNPDLSQENRLKEDPSSDHIPSEEVRTAGKRGPKKLQAKQRASVNALREQLDIENLKLQMPEQGNLIEDVFMAIEDMNASEQINISGSIKRKDAIQDVISKLKADNIRFVVHNLIKNKAEIKNKKSYLQACICNSIFDMKEINKDIESIIRNKKLEEEKKKKEEEERRNAQKEQYAKYPDLKEIDDELLKIQIDLSKAVLSKDEILLTKLKKRKETLLNERDLLLKKYNIEECQ